MLLATVTSLELVGRVALAGAFGIAIGIERERRAKAAGIRTHALVAVGSALFALVGAYGFADVGVASDPTRVAAQIASGIGFIGAGAIIRHGRAVGGLTTAATVWIAAALGVGAASGLYALTCASAGIGILVIMIGKQSGSIVRRGGRRQISFVYQVGHGTLAPVLAAVESVGVVCRVSVSDSADGSATPRRTLMLEVDGAKPGALEAAIGEILLRDEVIEVIWDGDTSSLDEAE